MVNSLRGNMADRWWCEVCAKQFADEDDAWEHAEDCLESTE
jgi:hypothetical protein